MNLALVGFTQEITLTRRAATIGNDGRATVTATTSTITAAVMPAGYRDLQRLPEGLRNGETVKVFTETDLQTAEAATGQVADRMTVNGVVYEVVSILSYGIGVLDHCKALAQKVSDAG